MRVIVNGINEVVGFEYRDLPQNKLVHKDFYGCYIDIGDKAPPNYGDVYDKSTDTFIPSQTQEELPPPIYDELADILKEGVNSI